MPAMGRPWWAMPIRIVTASYWPSVYSLVPNGIVDGNDNANIVEECVYNVKIELIKMVLQEGGRILTIEGVYVDQELFWCII